jgi:hypothetical protein
VLQPHAAFLNYELGWFYFLRLQWKEAAGQFESILVDCLSLSTELDQFVKNVLALAPDEEQTISQLQVFEDLFNRRFSQTKKKKQNWTKEAKDRVFLPHKVCLIAQLAG